MTALEFPTSPLNGDLFPEVDPQWIYLEETNSWERLGSGDQAYLPPLIRTTEQGPPFTDVAAAAGAQELIFHGLTVLEETTLTFYVQDTGKLNNYFLEQTFPAGADAADVAFLFGGLLLADNRVTAHYQVFYEPGVLQLTSRMSGADPLFTLEMSWPPFSEVVGNVTTNIMVVGADAGTVGIPAGVDGRFCLVGDFGLPRRVFLSTQIDPTIWVELATGSGGGGGGSGEETLYDLAAPANVNVGGIAIGDDITGKNWREVAQMLTRIYEAPYFNNFSIEAFPSGSVYEVGTAFSTSLKFVWGIVNGANISPASISIVDTSHGLTLASGLDNDNQEILTVATPTSDPFGLGAKTFHISALNTKGDAFGGDMALYGIYPWYWGVAANTATRPTPDAALVLTGHHELTNSSGSIYIPFASTINDYIWFAVPKPVSGIKTKWYRTELNTGPIGGGVGPGGNLFPAAQTPLVVVTTPLWTGIEFYVYVSNYRTAADWLEIRNA